MKNLDKAEIELMIEEGFLDADKDKNGNYIFTKEYIKDFDSKYNSYKIFKDYINNPSPYNTQNVNNTQNVYNEKKDFIDLDQIPENESDTIDFNWGNYNDIDFDEPIMENETEEIIDNTEEINEDEINKTQRERVEYDESLDEDTLNLAEELAEKELAKKEKRKKRLKESQKKRAEELKSLRERYKKDEESLYQKRINDEKRLEEQKKYEEQKLREQKSYEEKKMNEEKLKKYNNEISKSQPSSYSEYKPKYEQPSSVTKESQANSYNEYKPKYEQPNSVTQKTQTTSYESYSPAKKYSNEILTSMFGTREERKYDSNKPENITLIGTGKQIDAHESNTFAKSPNYNTSKVGFIEEAVKKFSQKSTKNEEKPSSHNRDTEDIAKKEKRKIEHVQDTSRTSPEDQTLINKKFRRHREGFGIEKYLKAVGQIALSAIEDYDVVKGYRAVKDITDLFLPTIGVRAAMSQARTQLRDLRNFDRKQMIKKAKIERKRIKKGEGNPTLKKEDLNKLIRQLRVKNFFGEQNDRLTALFRKHNLLNSTQILRLNTKRDIKNTQRLLNQYFSERGIAKDIISKYSTRELNKLLANKKGMLNNDDIELLQLQKKINRYNKTQRNVRKSRRTRSRAFKRLFDKLIRDNEIVQGYRLTKRAVMVTYKTIRQIVSVTMALAKGTLKISRKVYAFGRNSKQRIYVSINKNKPPKPLSERRKRKIQRKDTKTLRRQERMNSARYKKRQERRKRRAKRKERGNVFNRLKSRFLDTKFAKAIGSVGRVVFAPLRFLNSIMNFVRNLLFKFAIAFIGFIILVQILIVPMDMMSRTMDKVTGFFSNDDDEIPLAVKMADYIELELFGPFVRDCALKAERKRPSVPEIDNYDKIIVSFEDTDGNTFNSLRNTKDILAMAHVYFENAYADSEGEYKESTYKKYCKQLFENSCSYKFKESPVTYCGGCKTRTIRHSVSECPDPAIYSYTYPDEDGNPVTDSFTYCPSHQEIYCPGHMALYVIFIIRQFDDTISLTINDKMGLKERDAWEGWDEDMIEAVKDLMRKNWEKEYNYIHPEY